MRASRIIVVALAAVICAGFAIGIRQERSLAAAKALLSTGSALTPAQQRSAASDLNAAAFGYPGEDVAVVRGQLAVREHHLAQARSIAVGITRAEPDNLEGWSELAGVQLMLSNIRGLLDARNHMLPLDPIDTRPRH